MPEAWMVRSSQQQQLIESLIEKFHRKFDELTEKAYKESPDFDSESARQRFTSALLVSILRPHSPILSRIDLLAINFWEETKKEIRDFSRAEEERVALEWRFFLEIANSVSLKHETELSRKEFANPQQIFHAPSGMSDIEI